ncbi:pimeloyl-ACP methyl ester carboxylesterase [Streptomyces sp. SAI-135]|jgi:pimeloyl-ACP methyl ester carboxylesterase|uniref:alpha/beta hydrolase family protein n=1 Tax=unclassified Streptomyces TaxID=2593676 RepID=UPI002473FC5F|nr:MULTISPECIES: prolyl oligopeptidase family serine peptidase [unclassified Streptomyces]MDH6517316.1 pimeloyl-ACP methyl ester carboxylesterase [Streptomyces sp. SAI-090]MDH6618595.1 pimeloyl-ACP methyl ester carboxylesterase [Streptomyces sp. SAI-135]
MRHGTSIAATAALLLTLTSAPAAGATDAGPTHVDGRLPSGATYLMDVPTAWNGTVLLFSHGYTSGPANPAQDAPDEATKSLLLQGGYALIGSSYATTGWAVTDAVPDQLATLKAFTTRFGRASRTLAWGRSYGGLVTTAIAERHPEQIDGSLSLCGLVQGGVANWNNTLDPAFALRTLLGSDVPLVNLAGPEAATDAANTLTATVDSAQSTAAGRARIALAAALHNIPVWNAPTQTRPAATDWDAQQANQYEAVKGLLKIAAFNRRQEAETRAGGNMSWNTGVDYARLLGRSSVRKEVTELYQKAGLSLTADLAALDRAPRVSADPAAVAWMSATSSFTGELNKPQLSVHTIGDPLVPVQTESALRRAVTAAGSGPLLRQAYVDNAGHCTFSPAEQLAALHALEDRLTTGRWQGTDPASLNSRATAADPTTPSRYVRYHPTPYLRPYDLAHPADRR